MNHTDHHDNQGASEYFVLQVNVLEAGKMSESEHLQTGPPVGVFTVCRGQDLSKGVQGGNSGEPVTGSRAAKAQ